MGEDLDDFQEKVSETDYVIIICTPALKKKYDARKDVPQGLVQEIKMIRQRNKNQDKYKKTFLIYLKGEREKTCPSPYWGGCFSVEIPSFDLITSSRLYYYFKTWELFGALHGVKREEAGVTRTVLLKEMRGYFQGLTRPK